MMGARCNGLVLHINNFDKCDPSIKLGFLSKLEVVGKFFVCSKVVGICISGRYILTSVEYSRTELTNLPLRIPR